MNERNAAERTLSPQVSERRRADLLGDFGDKLGRFERFSIRLVRATFRPGLLDRCLRLCQRTIGQAWIHHATKHLRRVHGEENIPDLGEGRSVLVVSNHRSFFDLYVITAELVRRGLKKRIVFPVRSNFFYTNPLGLVVNFWMSFLSMYPPIFREPKRAALNLASLDELGRLLAEGSMFVGLHPEGTRNRNEDPYSFLPAQPGVGRVIHSAQNLDVVPVFVSGLGNDLWKQVKGNFTKKGAPIVVVFGPTVDLHDLLAERPSPRIYREISERCMRAIGECGEQERAIRARGCTEG